MNRTGMTFVCTRISSLLCFLRGLSFYSIGFALPSPPLLKDCIWDTFRSVHPLYTLIRPQVQSSIVRGLIDIQKHEGFLPDSRVANWNGRTQAGSNADVILADAFVKGLKGIDWEAGWAALVADAESSPEDFLDHGRGDIEYWWTIGYIPAYPQQQIYYHRSAARTIEYAYNDFCIAQVARGLGKEDEYKKYLNSSAKWQNLWNDKVTSFGTRGFIIPRSDFMEGGRFLEDDWKNVTLCSPSEFSRSLVDFAYRKVYLILRLVFFFFAHSKLAISNLSFLER